MSILAGLTEDKSIQENKDSLGSNFKVLESNIYEGVIEKAFLTTSMNGALALNLHIKLDNNVLYKEQLWMTTNKTKGCANYYYDKNQVKYYLMGFTIANHISLCATGKPLSKLDTEEKVIKLYNFDTQTEVPTPVNMVTAMLNKPVKLGIIKQLKNAVKRITTADNKVKYVKTNDIKESNYIDKVFHPTKNQTVMEIKAKTDKAKFIEQWKDKWVGEERNTVQQIADISGVIAGMPSSTSNNDTTDDLFK